VVSALYQISKNTFRESLREPIFLILLLSTLSLIGFFPTFALFVFREQVKLVVDSAMATALLFGWITAVLCASHAIAREINTGTALLLLAKPVKRPVFILAKILGILGALTVFWFLTAVATLMSVRVAKDQFRIEYYSFACFFLALALSCGYGGLRNYLKRVPFPMEAILGMVVILPLTAFATYWIPAGEKGALLPYSWEIVPALILIWYAILAMGTLATALSTRLDWVANLVVCSVVFVVGLMSDYLIGRHADGNPVLTFLYAIIPNWQLFWMADALAAKKVIPWEYVLLGGVYISLFVGAFLLLAVAMFHNREVGKQSLT